MIYNEYPFSDVRLYAPLWTYKQIVPILKKNLNFNKVYQFDDSLKPLNVFLVFWIQFIGSLVLFLLRGIMYTIYLYLEFSDPDFRGKGEYVCNEDLMTYFNVLDDKSLKNYQPSFYLPIIIQDLKKLIIIIWKQN